MFYSLSLCHTNTHANHIVNTRWAEMKKEGALHTVGWEEMDGGMSIRKRDIHHLSVCSKSGQTRVCEIIKHTLWHSTAVRHLTHAPQRSQMHSRNFDWNIPLCMNSTLLTQIQKENTRYTYLYKPSTELQNVDKTISIPKTRHYYLHKEPPSPPPVPPLHWEEIHSLVKNRARAREREREGEGERERDRESSYISSCS